MPAVGLQSRIGRAASVLRDNVCARCLRVGGWGWLPYKCVFVEVGLCAISADAFVRGRVQLCGNKAEGFIVVPMASRTPTCGRTASWCHEAGGRGAVACGGAHRSAGGGAVDGCGSRAQFQQAVTA